MAPSYAGMLFAITNTFGNTAGFLVPLVTGLITKNESSRKTWSYVWLIYIGVACFGGLVYIFLADCRQQDWGLAKKEKAKLPKQSKDSCHRLMTEDEPLLHTNPFEDEISGLEPETNPDWLDQVESHPRSQPGDQEDATFHEESTRIHHQPSASDPYLDPGPLDQNLLQAAYNTRCHSQSRPKSSSSTGNYLNVDLRVEFNEALMD